MRVVMEYELAKGDRCTTCTKKTWATMSQAWI